MKILAPEQRVEQLADKLQKEATVKAFQVAWSETRTVDGGFINEKRGDIYHPIEISDSKSGSYALELSSGKVSRGAISPSMTADDILRIAKITAYQDSEGLVLAEPSQSTVLPTVHDESVKDVIINSPAKVSLQLADLQTSQVSYGLESVEGGVSMSYSQVAFANSLGARYHSESTASSLSADYNNQVGHSLSKRTPIKLSDFQSLASSVVDLSLKLKNTAELKDGVYQVLIDPHYGAGLLDKFLLSNISGLQVKSGTGRYKAADFGNKVAMRPAITISINQLENLARESFAFTSDGVLPQSFSLIKDGQLVEPVCDLKTAKGLGVAARSFTTFRAGKVNSVKDHKTFNAKHPKYILILGVLGLHTQNSVLGDYSLPCPTALVVENGAIVGSTNCVISGNFFDTMLSDEFGFVSMPDTFEKPLLTFQTQVTVK
jgi:PmbA protein